MRLIDRILQIVLPISLVLIAHPQPKLRLNSNSASRTPSETDIAVLNHHDVFLGWIKKEDIHKLPIDKLSELDGIILTVELFIWAAGGGQCARGTLLINHGIGFP